MQKLVLVLMGIFALNAAAVDTAGMGKSLDPNAAQPMVSPFTDDQESSAGGTGQNCQSGNVSCNSGRTISCNATLGDVTHASLCTQHTGNVGWVRCQTFDASGFVTSSAYDECP